MSFLTRLRDTFRPARVEDDLDEEVQFHLDMRAADFERQGTLAGGRATRVATQVRQPGSGARNRP